MDKCKREMSSPENAKITAISLCVFPREFQKTVLLKLGGSNIVGCTGGFWIIAGIRKGILFICGDMRKGQQNLCFLQKDISINAGKYLLSSTVLLLEPLHTGFSLEQSYRLIY